MIDTHCHLTDPRLESQLDDVLERAASAGITRMITIGVDLADDERAISLCRGRENLRCAIGVHPNHVDDEQLAALPLLRGLQNDPGVVALGEMGLDYHYDRVDRMKQRRAFETQLSMARELNRPVVIHCREAVEDALAIMRDFSGVPAVFHCFTGTPEEAARILDAGYLIGFTGAVTFRKSEALRAVAAMAPEDRILVETDAPYLSPEPVRARKTNEPALVVHTAAAVARARGVGVEEIDRVTTQNAERFYRL